MHLILNNFYFYCKIFTGETNCLFSEINWLSLSVKLWKVFLLFYNFIAAILSVVFNIFIYDFFLKSAERPRSSSLGRENDNEFCFFSFVSKTTTNNLNCHCLCFYFGGTFNIVCFQGCMEILAKFLPVFRDVWRFSQYLKGYFRFVHVFRGKLVCFWRDLFEMGGCDWWVTFMVYFYMYS